MIRTITHGTGAAGRVVHVLTQWGNPSKVRDLYDLLAPRLSGRNVTSDGPGSWPEIIVVVDDYVDVDNGGLTSLLDFLPKAAEIGFRLIVARRAGDRVGPTATRMKELNCAQLVMSGSRSAGFPGSTLPPGVGRLVQGGPRAETLQTIQVGYLPPSANA